MLLTEAKHVHAPTPEHHIHIVVLTMIIADAPQIPPVVELTTTPVYRLTVPPPFALASRRSNVNSFEKLISS